ncbi:hydantoinase B/oxoprolinase family protein [Arthrobacter sp. MI7-26]|uniref:hydantoinase B/oxoprolinase family protein n=1 Tax=Arthrobacter sp. MI7-26 TaxID=2993653 RepID=UPI0022494396|nr:hydantoinase B/oxoprolinase family protein [Arthrobacter sp. MI7-26]MCX2750340.1 hydantoinase B/oxoprolinase family protein [Arthrobacter sp. MI7-26]
MATIIAPNNAPLDKIAVDPVTLDVIENALRNAREEMDAVVFRSAMSPGIREQHDEYPMIADPAGLMVVGQFGLSIPNLLAGYDGTVEEGDVLITSDPYACDGAISHANDWLVVHPIFVEGRLVGWAAQLGHMTDVGGKVPGSLPTDATTIFEEGVLIPPVKLYSQGLLNKDVLAMMLSGVRMKQWNQTDLDALIAACRNAGRRVQELCARFGTQTYLSTLDALLDRNYRAIKQLIETTIPADERLTFTDYICDDGVGFGPYKIECALWRQDGKLIADFTGTDPQSAGSINFYLNENFFKMLLGTYMIAVFDPQILWNDGFYPLIEVRIPDKSLLKPEYPAALSCRTHAMGRTLDVLSALLGQRQPEFLCAAGFSSSPHLMYSGRYSGGDRKGEWFQLYQIGFGGIPGRPAGDGPDGHSMWPSFSNVPNEYLESHFPLSVQKFESVVDSGGAGFHRGGNGIEIVYRFDEPGEVSIHDDRWFTSPWGVNGGKPGARSRKWINRADGSTEVLPSKCDHVAIVPGDQLHFVTWGGAGWGDPFDRDPELVAIEVVRGLVSVDGARLYGVVLSDDGTVNTIETEKLRTTMREERGEPQLFDMGDSIEVLRERCLEETGLPAPKPPVFAS